jgi:hypothetical protein
MIETASITGPRIPRSDTDGFNRAHVDIVSERAEPEQLVNYYFGILCHSRTIEVLDPSVSRIAKIHQTYQVERTINVEREKSAVKRLLTS